MNRKFIVTFGEGKPRYSSLISYLPISGRNILDEWYQLYAAGKVSELDDSESVKLLVAAGWDIRFEDFAKWSWN